MRVWIGSSALFAVAAGALFAGAVFANGTAAPKMEIGVWDVSFQPSEPSRVKSWYHLSDPAAVQAQVAAEAAANKATRARLYPRFAEIHATHVRVWFHWTKDPDDFPAICQQLDDEIAEMAAHGMKLQLTISGGLPAMSDLRSTIAAFMNEPAAAPDINAFGAFVSAVATHFRGRVPRYSLWNEPNWVGLALAAGSRADVLRYATVNHFQACIAPCLATPPVPLAQMPDLAAFMAFLANEPAMAADYALLKGMLATPSPQVTAVLADVKKWLGREGSRLYSKKGGIDEESVKFIHEVWVRGYEWIKRADPQAQVLIGELASWQSVGYLKKFLEAGPEDVIADGFALHPYQDGVGPELVSHSVNEHEGGDGGIGSVFRFQEVLHSLRHRLKTHDGKTVPLYLTEFGYHQQEDVNPKQRMTESQRVKWLPRAFERAKEAGAREMLYYQLIDPGPGYWNTSILAPDTTPNPSFLALEKWAEWQQSAHPEDAFAVAPGTPALAVTIHAGKKKSSKRVKASTVVALENVGADTTWMPGKTELRLVGHSKTKASVVVTTRPWSAAAPTQGANFNITVSVPEGTAPERVALELGLFEGGKRIARGMLKVELHVLR